MGSLNSVRAVSLSALAALFCWEAVAGDRLSRECASQAWLDYDSSMSTSLTTRNGFCLFTASLPPDLASFDLGAQAAANIQLAVAVDPNNRGGDILEKAADVVSQFLIAPIDRWMEAQGDGTFEAPRQLISSAFSSRRLFECLSALADFATYEAELESGRIECAPADGRYVIEMQGGGELDPFLVTASFPKE